MTDFTNICDILGVFYSQYKDEEQYREFISQQDLGLPIAYFTNCFLVEPTDEGVSSIMETWEAFLEFLGLEDMGYTDLFSVLDKVEKSDA